MKKLFKLALVGTMVLAAAACQREQLANTEAPEETGVREVTTQFVLNVAASPKTKMSADVVQQNDNFRGIQDAVLYTYKTGIAAPATPYVLNPASTADKKFEFPFFFASSGLDNTGDNNLTGDNAPASKRVLQLSIPVGTDAVLFYGKALRADGVNDSDFGATAEATISDTPANTVFKAKKILNDSNVTKYDRTGALMIYMINDVLGSVVPATSSAGTVGSYPYTYLPELKWSSLGHQYEIDNYPGTSRYTSAQGVGHAVTGLEEVLGKCYYLFTYLTPSQNPNEPGTPAWDAWNAAHPDVTATHEEYRSGSSTAVKSMIIDMYKIITAANDAEATNDEEANAKRLAAKILSNASKYFDTTNGKYKEVSQLETEIPAAAWASFSGAEEINDYPGHFGVPEGAAQLGFKHQSATQPADEFYYKHPNQPLVNWTMAEFEPRKYLFPAELWYYVNSPIRTSSDGSITAASYPDGINNWKNPDKWSGWTANGSVNTSTRAVAVTNSINYGVALLNSTVKYGAANLSDNRYAMTNHADADRVIPAASAGLQVKGILIGGVNPRMNWQFIRKYETTGDPEGIGDLSLFDGVIYDHSWGTKDSNKKDVPVAIPSTGSTPSLYTLVYDNYNSSEGGTQDKQNDVYIALELVNTGDAFWGRDNLIPKDGIFYLVAKLAKPDAGQVSGITWPTDHEIPPVDAAGASKHIARIFMQDFVTTANFTIGSDALKKAYYSIPDLRASQMSLGLSVDLQWTPGITYNVTL